MRKILIWKEERFFFFAFPCYDWGCKTEIKMVWLGQTVAVLAVAGKPLGLLDTEKSEAILTELSKSSGRSLMWTWTKAGGTKTGHSTAQHSFLLCEFLLNRAWRATRYMQLPEIKLILLLSAPQRLGLKKIYLVDYFPEGGRRITAFNTFSWPLELQWSLDRDRLVC